MNKVIRIIAIVLVVGLLGFLLVRGATNNEKATTEQWNANMVIGDAETAERHYYYYTDIMCPFCNKFARALQAHEDEFKKDYIEDKHIVFELRLTDELYLYHKDEHEGAINSLNSASNAYCAADQGKFWEYYHNIVGKLYDDYYSRGIGTHMLAERIPKLEMDYFKDAAKDIEGLDFDKFSSCVDNGEKLADINKNTQKALRNTKEGGLPYFQFGKYSTVGFDGDWDAEGNDWEKAKLILDAGL